VDMKLEVVTVPVTDIDRAAQFYKDLGWRLDADLGSGNSRVVQLTPPGSPCSVHLRLDGAHRRFRFVVSDVEAARDELVAAGVAVGEYSHVGEDGVGPGLDPQRRSYRSYAPFPDPDGNEWVLQEITQRLPGR
jgi:catechol 2,3-dioxygenase-like lactoylglutathione lyase family enzyme